jgi:hypothetical protein
MQSPIFIVGLHRTGSSLLTNIFRKNPNILIFEEMHFLSAWRKDFNNFHKIYLKNNKNIKSTKKLVELFFSKDKFPGLNTPFWNYFEKHPEEKELKDLLTSNLLNSNNSLESIFKIIIEKTTYYRGYERCCVKFPMHISFVPRLFEWYPDSKIIHITRDPRAILVSKKNDPGGIIRRKDWGPVVAFLLRRLMLFYVFLQFYKASKIHDTLKFHKNYFLVKYEDLLNNQLCTIKKLCEFTNMQFHDGMSNPQKGQYSSITGEKREGFDKASAFRWKNEIWPYEDKLMSFLAKSSMGRFGIQYR